MINKLFPISLLLILSSCFFTSCNKPADPSNSSTTFFAATVNGSPWTAKTVNASNGSGSLAIQANGAVTGNSMGLVVPSTNPGIYPLASGSKGSIVYKLEAGSTYISATGNIVISTFSNNIVTGTFQGSCLNFGGANDTMNVANGSFSVKIQ